MPLVFLSDCGRVRLFLAAPFPPHAQRVTLVLPKHHESLFMWHQNQTPIGETPNTNNQRNAPMFSYTSPRGTEATDDRVIEAATNYKKFGGYPFYKDIPLPAKRIASAYILGAALGMTVDEVDEQGEHSSAFRVLVDQLITGYENRHPQPCNHGHVLAMVLRELADRLQTAAPVDGDQLRFDQEFAEITKGLEVSGL